MPASSGLKLTRETTDMGHQQFTCKCSACGNLTSRVYARQHGGKCKACSTGQPAKPKSSGLICPDCGKPGLTLYQKQHGYHCDACTREADPEGYRREVMGLNDEGCGQGDY